MADPYRYFRIEAAEILEQLQKGLLELEKGAPASTVVPPLLRLSHTLKGAARVVKQKGIAELAHAIEDVLIPSRDAGASVSPSIVSQALGHVDAMRAQLLALSQPVSVEAPSVPVSPSTEEAFWAAKPNVQDLDLLLDGVVELNTQLGAVRRSRRELERAKNLADLLAEQAATRGRDAAGAGRSAHLHALAEELQAALVATDRELGAAVEQAGRELGQVRDAAERLRLVPAELMWGSLERTARDVALSSGKRVKLEVHGGDVRLDADLLTLMQRALMQAVRNAVAHGIETPAERAAASKSEEGHVLIDVERRDRDVVFSCRDDGRGLDFDAIRRSAEKRGIAASALSTMGNEQLTGLLLRGGISTAAAITGVSGRGIGLDLVRDTAEKLGGGVTLETTKGRGTTISARVPVSLSALLALLAEVNGRVVALPLSAVRGTARQISALIARTAEGETIVLDGAIVPYVALRRLLADGEANTAPALGLSTVLVASDSGQVALGVDRLLGIESIVVRALPELVLTTSVVSGASFDADGESRIVLSPVGLVRAARRAGVTPRPVAPRRAPILVIDDSLTTRMLEQSILESAGYEVDLATSGEEGLEQARQRKYALFLVDVEMPGMDGFSFIEETRRDPTLAHIPAILVTSRASAEDVARGIAVGASAHMEKREFNQTDLLERIRKLVS